ncbi:hypothetical protein P3T26_001003 [Streptomyces sp. MAA16]|nr:hypothetical protein [Streptomyces sp. MAA16]
MIRPSPYGCRTPALPPVGDSVNCSLEELEHDRRPAPSADDTGCP